MEGQDHIDVAVIDDTLYLKPVGYATQHNCLGVPDFLDAMLRMGCQRVAVDLGECRGMDSTFLGVLADAAATLRRQQRRSVVVVNCSEEALRQLKRIGLLPMLCVCEHPVTPPNVKTQPIDDVHFPKNQRERLETIKRLHEQLIRLNKGNEALFGPFVQMLEEELQRCGLSGS